MLDIIGWGPCIEVRDDGYFVLGYVETQCVASLPTI